MTSGRVTSADVARVAGVSRATVSYVVNNVEHQRVSADTRDRVREVARRLGYAPNSAARALKGGRNELVVIGNPPWALGPLVATAVSAAVERLVHHGLTPVLAIGSAATGDHFIQACQRIRPVGLIAPTHELTPAALRTIRACGTEAVVAMGDDAHAEVPSGVFDQCGVGRIAVKHLVARGHEHVLAISPSQPLAESQIGERRLAGARTAAERAGIRLTTARVRGAQDLESTLRDHLTGAHRPTGVFAYNDELALAVINRLHSIGLSVPDDVALVGCDDIPAARYSAPPLTTVAPQAVTHYRAVADRLVDELHSPGPTNRIMGRNRLMQRAST